MIQRLKNNIKRVTKGKDWKHREGLVLSLEKGGNRFYTFADSVAPSGQRVEAVLDAVNRVGLGITKEDEQAFHKTMDQLLSFELGVDPSTILIKAKQLNDYYGTIINQPFNVKPVLYMALPIVLINDEPLKAPTEKHTKQKIALFDNDSEIRDFFLRKAEYIWQTWGTDSGDLKFLEEVNKKSARWYEDQFLNMITSQESKNISSKETSSI